MKIVVNYVASKEGDTLRKEGDWLFPLSSDLRDFILIRTEDGVHAISRYALSSIHFPDGLTLEMAIDMDHEDVVAMMGHATHERARQIASLTDQQREAH